MTLGQEPKTRRSRRTVPVARSVMRQVEEHLARFVDPDPDAQVFTAPRGGRLARSLFARRVWQPAAKQAGLPGITFHGLRHNFVAILVAAGCNVREVSEWAGHNNVALTLNQVQPGCRRPRRLCVQMVHEGPAAAHGVAAGCHPLSSPARRTTVQRRLPREYRR